MKGQGSYMITFFKSLPFHIKTAMNSIRRNLGNAVSSVFAVTVTLILIMLFAVVALNVSGFTVNIEDNVQIFARVDDINDNHEQLQEEIEDIAHVDEVVYSDADEQLEKVMSDGEGLVSIENENPLPAAFYIDVDQGKNVEAVTDKIESMDGIMDASYGGDTITEMINSFNSLRVYGGVFVGIISLLSIFLISNTIRVNIFSRRNEIAIMRNVGASNWFIKVPFLIEGMFIGIIGSIVPILVTIFGYGFLYDSLGGQFFTAMFKLRAPMPFVMQISGVLLGVGVIVGLVGSFISINKHLKWKR